MLTLSPIIMEDLANIISEPIQWKKLKDKTVLITGASGMIASYLVYTLLYLNDVKSINCRVIGTVRNLEKAARHFDTLCEREDFILLKQDVSEPMVFDGKIDFIIHAASQTGPNQFINDPVGTIKANAFGTMHLLELAKEKKIEKFMYLSTREIYGKVDEQIERVSEDEYGVFDHTTVRASYPESKKMGETLCVAYGAQYNIPYVITRIEHTYGPGMPLGDGRVMSDFIGNVVNGDPIVMKSEGLVTLNLTYLSDLVVGLFYSLLNFEDTIYNISTNARPIMVKEVAALLAELFVDQDVSVEKRISQTEQGNGYLQYRVPVLNANKSIKESWICKVTLREGLKRTVRYYINR